MRILTGSFSNFGSYKSVDFDFESEGLTLIHGSTGSGKSTIPDMIAWALFGQTLKGGSVDDVRSWTAEGEPTKATLTVKLAVNTIIIYRNRGKHSENDLYWTEDSSDTKHRGKDITETQKLLEKRIGISPDLYLYAAYFSEFSPTGSFFVAKAKERRELFENLANMKLAKQVLEGATNERKYVRAEIEGMSSTCSRLQGSSDAVERHLNDAIQNFKEFEKRRNATLSELEDRSKNFTVREEQRKLGIRKEITKLEGLIVHVVDHVEGDVCPTCGSESVESVDRRINATRALGKNELIRQKIGTLRESLDANPVNSSEDQIRVEVKKVNPFDAQITKLEQQSKSAKLALKEAEMKVGILQDTLQGLNTIYDLSFQLRGVLLGRTIQQIQDKTNEYLDLYFESPLKVAFEINKSDDLTVTITKDSYECGYKQLSKGQRGLLKLCFSVSVMEAAANQAGIQCDNLWFDEALDGLDPELKVKAFSLFEKLSLSHSTVMVIEHSEEFKALFDRRYHVNMVGNNSEVELES